MTQTSRPSCSRSSAAPRRQVDQSELPGPVEVLAPLPGIENVVDELPLPTRDVAHADDRRTENLLAGVFTFAI